MANSLKNKFKYSALAALIVTLLSCTVMAFAGLGFGAPAETANADAAQNDGAAEQSSEDLVAAWNSAVESGGTFTLTEDWIAASPSSGFGTGDNFYLGGLYVPAGKSVTLDLNGHTLDRNSLRKAFDYDSDNGSSVIEVRGTLTIQDSAIGGTITGGYGNYDSAGVLYGGGVRLMDGAELILNGGTITGNGEILRGYILSGGGVSVGYRSRFEMNGGKISGNLASTGGALCVNSGAMFAMNGGTITDNIADDGFIDGVLVQDNSTLAINGGDTGLMGCHKGSPYNKNVYYVAGISSWMSIVELSLANPESQVVALLRSQWTANSTHSFGTGTGFKDGAIHVPAGANIVLDLNGRTIDRGGKGGSVFCVEGTLEIVDTSSTQAGKITGGYLFGNGYGAGINVNGGNLTITGGNISGNEADHAEGGGVYVKNGTFTMNGGTISSNDGYAGAGGVQLVNSTFIMNKGEIVNNTTTGGVYVASGSTFIMNGGTISGNTANSNGGGVNTNDSTFEMTDGEISGNTGSNGGGVYVSNNGAFEMTGGEITGNTGSSGCGVYIYRDGKFEMSAGKISGNTSNNSATNGGGVYNQGTFTMTGGAISGNQINAPNSCGGGVYSSGTFTMNGGTISGNETLNGEGAGVYAPNGTFTMTNGTISGNTANTSSGAGGGIYMYSGTYNISGGTISNNSAYRGGGVYKTGSGGVLTMTGGTISGNIATEGGGVWFMSYNGSTFNLQGGTISGNTAQYGGGIFVEYGDLFNMTGGSIFENKATVFGDNICFAADWASAVKASSDNNIKVSVISNGFSAYNGSFGTGTGYYNGTLYVPEGANIELDLDGKTINRGLTSAIKDGSVFYVEGTLEIVDTSSTQAGKITGGYNVFDGGGFRVEGGDLTLNGGTVTGNFGGTGGNSGGGGVYVGENGTFTMNGGEISDNSVGMAHYNSAGVCNYGSFTMNGGKITGNNGIGVYMNTNANFTMFNGEISNNDGGVVAEGESSFTMNGGTISGNTADSGGGVNVYGTFEMNGGTISDNSSNYYGGGVFVGGTFEMNGGTISGNTVSNSNGGGGGVYNGGTFTMNGGTISGNTAQYGGGVFNEATFIMNGGTVLGNTANNSGGGVYFSAGIFTMNGGTIGGSEANMAHDGSGGGVYVRAGSFTFTAGIISNNTAPNGGGGGVYIHSGTTGTFKMSGGTISGNTAVDGGGVYVFTDSTFEMNGGEISNNTASGEFGGGGVFTMGTFTMNAGQIKNNSASHAGGVWFNSGEFTMNGGTISNNTATTNAGGVHVRAGTFTMNGGTIFGNTASMNGGGVLVHDTFIMNGGTISGNTASMYGGGVHVVGLFGLKGGTITANSAGSNGGGISVADTFKLEKGTVIGNSVNGLANNVYLYNNKVITIIGSLLNGGVATRIGVTMQTPSTITSGYSTYNSGYGPSVFFFADDSHVLEMASGEVVFGTGIVTPTTVTWQISSDGTNWNTLDGTNNTVYYSGATYTVRVMNGSTVLKVYYEATSHNNGSSSGMLRDAGSYAFIYNGSNIENPIMNLEILPVEITWQYSQDGGASWTNFDGVQSSNNYYTVLNSTYAYSGKAWQVRAYDAVNGKVVSFNSSPGEVKNAGTYSWSVGYAVNEKNYKIPLFNLTITEITLEIEWNFSGATLDGNKYFWTYDGIAHAPVPVITGAPNEQIGNIDLSYIFDYKNSSFTFAKADSGEYVLTVYLKEEDPNIILANNSVTFYINPKSLSLEFTGATDNKITVEYDGNGHGVEAVLSGLVSKDYAQEVVISYYLGSSLISGLPTNVGTYTARATLPADCINYVLDKTYECVIVIDTKTVTVNWAGNDDKNGDFVWTFDGTGKAPSASITDPVSGNGMTIRVTYAAITGGVRGAFTSTKPVNAGNYVMRVELSVASDKYVLEDTEREFEIEKLGVTLTWKYDGVLENGVVRWEYDGQSHNVVPEINGVQVIKDGTLGVDLKVVRKDNSSALTNVGRARASAALDTSDSFNNNFYIINETSIIYEVYKRVITSAVWTDKDGNTFNLGSSASYDFGEVSGAKGPDFTATAVGANGDLTLTVTYSASFTGDWPVDEANGYVAYATLSAADAKNYCFADGGDVMSITFVIRSISGSKENIDVTWVIFTDAENYLTLDSFIAANGGDKFFFTYNGTAQAPTALYIKDDGTYEELAISKNSKGTDAGNYTARLLPSDSYNIPAEQATCDYEIKPLDITIVWQNAVDDSQKTFTYVYDGKEHAPYPTVTGNGGVPCKVEVVSEINAGNYTATALVGGNFNVVAGLTQNFTVKQMELNVSLIEWSANGAEERKDVDGNSYYVWVYDGKDHAPEATITIEQLGITLNLSVLGATAEVGTSYALAVLNGSDETHANFKLNGTAQQRFEIVRVPAGTVIWEDGKGNTSIDGDVLLYLTFNGTAQAPVAYFMNGDTKVTLSVLGAMTDVGTYKAWVTGDFDFGGKTPECEFTIVAKKLNVEWSETTATFNGSAQSPVATVVDEDLGYTLVKGTDYTVDAYVNAGGYSAGIRFINKNYTYDGETNKTAFTIEKINLSEFASWSFGDAEAGEDGVYTVQYSAGKVTPEVTVDGFTLDGAAVTFTFAYTGASVNVGNHTVTAKIASAMWNGKDISANLTLGDVVSLVYNITPFEITVEWSFDGAEQDGDSYFWYYDTTEHAPKAYFTDWSGDRQELTVYGAAVNARPTAYTASVSAPANCIIKNAEEAETSFVIKQATIEVEWSAEGDYKFVDGVYVWVYDGKAHAPKAVIKGTTNALPVLGIETDAGEYVATAAQNDGNYVISGGATQKFKIEALTVNIKWFGVDGSEENFKWPYSGKEQAPTAKLVNADGELILDKDGNAIEVEVAGGSATVGTHTALATNTFINYVFATGAKVEQTFEITAKVLEGFEWSKDGATVTEEDGNTVYTYIYNGTNLQPIPTSSFGSDLDFKVTIIDVKTGKEVQAITESGTYTVTAASLNANFAIPEDKATIKVVVNPFKAVVVWGEEELVYNGSDQKPTAHFIDVNGNEVSLTVTVEESEHSAAGKYTAKASLTTASANYALDEETSTTTFEIEKVKLAVEWQWTGWTDKELTYDGKEHTPVPDVKAAAALNLTVSYVVYDKDGKPVADNKVVNAGDYKIKLTVSGDGAGNYTFDKEEETFTIKKKAITITVNDLTINYGEAAPEYTAEIGGLVEEEKEALLELIMAQKGRWLRCEYVIRYAPGEYEIGVVTSVLADLLKNYEVPAATGTLTVKVVPFTVVWYKDGSNNTDYNAYYTGNEYKPSAYYVDNVNGDLIPLDVVYATYNEATGEYTPISDASAAIDAGKYYVMVVTPDGITLTNAGTSYEIFKLNITVNIDSVEGVFGDVYNSDGELIHATLTYKFGDVKPVDDLGIKLTLSCADPDFDGYGFLNVGKYNVVGSWNEEAFGKNYNLEFVGEAEEESGHNSYGTYVVSEAEITVTKDKEIWSNEEFEEILASSSGQRQYIALDTVKPDDNGEEQYAYIDYAGHKSADNVSITFSVLHDLNDHDVPNPEDDRYYNASPYMDAAGRYAVNYKIEIANHVTRYGTWYVLIVPADGIITIEFVKDYEVTYGDGVPENIAALLLDGGYINVYGYNTNAFARSAVVTVSDGIGGAVDATTGVGRYTVNIEIASDDPNEINYVRFTDDSNIGRFVITPKLLTVDWGETTFTQDKDNLDKVWIDELNVTVSGFVNAEALKLENILVSADGDYAATKFEVTDNGALVTLILTATGDFKSAGGNTLVLAVENGNYEIAVENSAAAVTINAPAITPSEVPAQGGAPAWLWWVLAIIVVALLILIIVVAVLAKRKQSVAGDDDGFYEDANESDGN